MQLPKISIVTPSFNQEQFLEETIKSVVDQNYPNLEYVIIDGASTDHSVDIIKKYEKKLHYWISEKDEGHGHALNKGFSKTSGEIMAWINSDDKYTPWAFQVVSEIFSKFPHVMWIVGFTSTWNSAGAMTTAKRCPKNIYDFLTGNYAWIQQESVFWRRELWEKTGGYINQEYKFMVDGELWTRFFLHAELYSVDCILGGYRIHSHNRALQNYAECMKEIEHAITCMKKKCTDDTLKNLEKIKRVKKIKNMPFIRAIAPFHLGSLYSVLAKEVDYRNIAFKEERWKERNLLYFEI